MDKVLTARTPRGKIQFQATCESGLVVTFWESNFEKVVEIVDETEGIYALKSGVSIAPDGGLIPEESTFKGFFS